MFNTCILIIKDEVDEAIQRPRKRQRLDIQSNGKLAEFHDLPSTRFGPDRGPRVEQVPGHLYNLTSAPKPPLFVTLPPISGKRLTITTDPISALYTAAGACMQDLISRELIYPHLKVIDHFTTQRSSKSKPNVTGTCERAITRGAILACLADACQSDGIFASDGIKSFLSRPTQELIPTGQSNSRDAKSLQSERREELLLPLKVCLQEHLSENPGIVNKAAQLGNIVDAHLTALHNGGVVDYHDDFLDLTAGDSNHKSRMYTNTSNSHFDVSSLLSNIQSPRLTILAVILREALNRARGLPFVDEISHRILLGQHPSQSSSKSYPPCQTNPIRQFSEYALLVKKHLPSNCLTTSVGLSNLLSWMGTGQGSMTKPFLNSIARPSGFFSSNIDEIIEIFHVADSNNIMLSLQSRPTYIHLKRISGYIPCFDQEIWGQPNNLLNLHPTIRSKARSALGSSKRYLTVEEKLSPYWTESVQSEWVGFLGGMVGCEPDVWTGERPTWLSTLDFVHNLSIPLFGRGLTLLQTANNLVFADIVAMPSVVDVAFWIAKHRTLGAYRGLQMLGFSNMSSTQSVLYAFRAVYDHLNENLTADDKKILGFSPLFLEHTLCKVARWSSRLSTASKTSVLLPNISELSSLAESLAIPWVPGNNGINYMAFPFPLTITTEKLTSIVKELVSHIILHVVYILMKLCCGLDAQHSPIDSTSSSLQPKVLLLE